MGESQSSQHSYIHSFQPEPTISKRLKSVESYSSFKTQCNTPPRTRPSSNTESFLSTPCLIENNQIQFDIQTLHSLHPFQSNSLRSSYYHKLIYKNILTSKTYKTHNTIFIFDWDDTLFPTSFLSPRGFKELPELCSDKLLQTEQLVHSLLSKALSKGLVYIVTNSSEGWVERSAGKFYPSIKHMLKYVNIISARCEYEGLYPGDPFNWKYLAFKKIKEGVDERTITNLLVIGDSWFEIEAGEKISKLFEECYVKTIKLKVASTLEGINKQLKLVNDEFLEIYSAVNNLSVKVEKRK